MQETKQDINMAAKGLTITNRELKENEGRSG
jgi:hypothetical protein